jgi:hypothetical protein
MRINDTTTHTLSGGAMDEKHVLQKFKRQTVITITQLVQLLQCSVITARRRLKKWKTYTSINKNGRYYTLPQIPVFDANGLWRYQTILFSKHGNLKQTIIQLIRQAPTGLSAAAIAKMVAIAPSSSLFVQIKNVAGIRREKHQGRFIYFSDNPAIYNCQKQQWALSRQNIINWPTDAEAVVILVQLIKHPGIDLEQLADKVAQQGQRIAPAALRSFLQWHGLLKKNSDIKL